MSVLPFQERYSRDRRPSSILSSTANWWSNVRNRWATRRPTGRPNEFLTVFFAFLPPSPLRISRALHPLSSRHVRSPFATAILGHREGGPYESVHGDSPGAAGFEEPPVTPRKGARTDNPLPPRPQRRPRGKGPRQAPSGAQKRGKWFWGRRREEEVVKGQRSQMKLIKKGATK